MKRTLILHAGMPKTGTTAFQLFLGAHQEYLKSLGILYPSTGTLDFFNMRHHWLINALLLDDRASFERRMEDVERECAPDTHTIVLSSEPFFVHWGDFRPGPRAWLARAWERYDVRVWVWLRDAGDFCRSWYVQALRSPQTDGFPVFGRDLSVAEFLDDSWVAAQFDYRRRCAEMEAVFGSDSVFAFAFARDTVDQGRSRLRFPHFIPEIRMHETLFGESAVAMLRIINRYPLAADEKRSVNTRLRELTALLGDRSAPFALTPSERACVNDLCTMTLEEIAVEGARSVERWDATYLR